MLKGIILVVLLVASVLMPFNVYAGTVTGDAPIIGVNVYVIDYEYGRIPVQGTVTLETDMTRWQCVSGSSSRCAVWQSQDTSDNVQNDITGTITYSNGSYSAYLYEFDFVFDDEYVGYVRFSSQITAGSGNIYYVNGSHLTITSTTLINSFSVTEYQLTRKSDENIMWMFPLESYIFVNYMFRQSFTNVGFQNFGNYYFPRFLEDNSKYALQYTLANGTSYYMIFVTSRASNVYNIDSFNRYFTYNSNITLESFQAIYAAQGARICKLLFSNSSGSNQTLNFGFANSSTTETFIPIYFGNVTNEFISTDFALNFGLSNRLLNNLDIIANGTINSNQSVLDVDSQNQQFESDRDDLIDIEDNFNEDMNEKLDVIDTNTGVSGFGGYFMNSAVWVRTQFDRLTNNTPYGSLIVYGMTLGLALLLLGKVFL